MSQGTPSDTTDKPSPRKVKMTPSQEVSRQAYWLWRNNNTHSPLEDAEIDAEFDRAIALIKGGAE